MSMLFLPEGICSLLGTVQYHSQVWRERHTDKPPCVPTIRVSVVTSIKVLPHQSVVAPIEAAGMKCRMLHV